jgi:hypothetical protein
MKGIVALRSTMAPHHYLRLRYVCVVSSRDSQLASHRGESEIALPLISCCEEFDTKP